MAEHDELICHLRELSGRFSHEAASAIETLVRERDALRAALEPFAKEADRILRKRPDLRVLPDFAVVRPTLTVGELRQAARAHAGEK
jgi:hypothetical protein